MKELGPVSTSSAAIPALPEVSARVRELLSRMTLEEKLAQLVGYWLDQGGNVVAPMQGEMGGHEGTGELADVTRNGIGHYTRVYGTRPVDGAERAAWLWQEQRRLQRETRLGIPALVHEECLTGLAAWKATTYPTPLAWGASFDPQLVGEVGAAIGRSMHALGIHQGLAPVMDVIRDPRWGRVDECIGEDPYLVGTIGTAFVKGLQSEGVHATLKHFLGYSGSAAGRNHAPTHVGPREVADVFLPPFEMAILDGNARSVMNSYVDIDGIPMAANEDYLTGVLREQLGFTGVVVADYFAIAFLQVMQAVAADRGEAARLALVAGIDVELPAGDAYLEPLAAQVRSGAVDEGYVDRAVLRALAQKESLGLLDPEAYADEPPAAIDLDSPQDQALARALAQRSVVLLANDGVLPLSLGERAPARIAVIGPNADRAEALQGCYSFANHVLEGFPGYPAGIAIPTVSEALAAAVDASGAQTEVVLALGCTVEGDDRSGIAAAVAAAAASDVAVVVVGDQAGLFGRGTVGEGNDTDTLALPGLQRELVEAVVATGTPVVLVLLTGRPYAIGWALDGTHPRPAAVLQAFFPGEGGGLAIADIITGQVNPSGRLPVTLPRSAGAQPYSYLQPILGGPSEVTSTDPTPLRPFGFGLSYTTFTHTDLVVDDSVAAGGTFRAAVTVTNSGPVAGADVVQLYGHDVIGSVVRPVAQLLGYARVELPAGECRRVTFEVPTTRLAFSDRRRVRIVEPGAVEVWVASHAGASAEELPSVSATNGAISNSALSVAPPVTGTATARACLQVTGTVHEVSTSDPRLVVVHLGQA
jgi:beta-xylosidase